MTWQEVLNSNHETVIVQSHGYTEKSFFSSHFEPFSHLREFKFKIVKEHDGYNNLWCYLEHKWLNLEDDESLLTFEEKAGKVYCFDPDLWARP